MRITSDYTSNNIRSNYVNFGTNWRQFNVANPEISSMMMTLNSIMKTTTRFFREDLNWNDFSKYLISHFGDKPKVNVIQYGASDGSEAYSLIINLIEHNPAMAKKFFPIEAYDIDSEIIKVANSGRIKITTADKNSIASISGKFSKYFSRTAKNLQIPNEVSEYKLFPPSQYAAYYESDVYNISPVLKSRVHLQLGDGFKLVRDLEDESNTVLMCRNFLGYYHDDYILEFLEAAAKNLKKDSLLVIGFADHSTTPMDFYIKSFNFKPVMKNVYQKMN